jgi:Protein of unknown function (DUF2721)
MQAALGTSGAMAAIAAAVTPVVMISANAILIGGISSKHDSMSSRLRTLTAEWRSPETNPARRDSVRAQVQLLSRRLQWISRSHFLLYVATVCFVAMVMVLALTAVNRTWADFSLPLLMAGVSLMLVAIFLELLDLRKANATIEIEARDLSSAPISDPQHSDPQHSNPQHSDLKRSDAQQPDPQHSDPRHSDAQHSDAQHSEPRP